MGNLDDRSRGFSCICFCFITSDSRFIGQLIKISFLHLIVVNITLLSMWRIIYYFLLLSDSAIIGHKKLLEIL